MSPSPQTPDRGLFLVLEGLDGAGTTTQANRIVAALQRGGRPAQFTSEPSEGPVGELLKQILDGRVAWDDSTNPMALLFAADRLDHLEREIVPLLERGTDVVCDRYVLSSLAYQTAPDLTNLEWLCEINEHARRPDLTLFLRSPFEVCRQRRDRDREHESTLETESVQTHVESSYEHAIERLRNEGETIEIVDGTLPIDDVTSTLAARLADRFPEYAFLVPK